MVGIRRPAPRGLRGVVTMSDRSSSSWSLVRYARTSTIAFAALYGLSILFSIARVPSSDSTDGYPGGASPMGLVDVLKSSHLRMPGKKKPNPGSATAPYKHVTSSKEQNKSPSSIQKYDHQLEDPDIHMQHPDLSISKEKRPAEKEVSRNGHNLNERGAPIHSIVLNKKGSGPTNVSYVQDFQDERDNPAFRHKRVQVKDASSAVATLVQELRVTPCRQIKDSEYGDQQRWAVQARCLSPNTPQIVYNAASFGRTLCGQEIGPGSAVIMDQHCQSFPTAHIFPHNKLPSASGQGMPPIILKSTSQKIQDKSMLEPVDCDIPCLAEPGLTLDDEKVVATRFFEGEPWSMVQTLGSAFMTDGARLERINYRKDIYYSTQSFKSDVPLSFYDPEKFSLRNRPPIAYDSAKPKAVYLVSEGCTMGGTNRQKYFDAISLFFSVDSLGSCSHNTDVPAGMNISTLEGRIEVMKQYRFVLALDKFTEKDHIYPVVWEAFLSGSVPVVLGADNKRFHLPANSYIDSATYSNWDTLAQAIKEINEDKEKWESYHAWRTDEEVLSKFEAMYEFTKTSPNCRLCRWGYAKKYGLGWDHVKQKVTDTHISRRLCTTSANGLVLTPFEEEWVSRNEEEAIIVNQVNKGGSKFCGPSSEAIIDNGSTYKIYRSLAEHDGVTDLIVSEIERESTNQELVLRMHFPGVQNSDGAHFVNTHNSVPDLTHGPLVSSASIQDDFTKVTVLADWVTSISSFQEGVLEMIVVAQHENEEQPRKPLIPNIPKRVRIIVEDMNAVHDKLTEYFPSSFAKLMIKDFVDPLELYVSD